MNNLYEQYLKEREDLDVIRNDHGFIAFKIIGDECLISDYFVTKAFRKNGIGYSLGNEVFAICRNKDVKTVFCQTDESSNGHGLSRHTIENYGFKQYMKVGTINHYKMEVKHG